MKSPFQRIAALALCFTLTLGVFAYRPSEAKAIAGVDDAVVIGALLSAFAGGCGLIFSNNGMTSSELAQGLTDKWNEFKAAVLETDTTFAGWLGYEDMDALLQAIVLSGGNALTLPRAIARKLSEFTTWLTDNLALADDGSSQVLASGHFATLANGSRIDLGYTAGSSVNIPANSRLTYGERWDFSSGSYIEFTGSYNGVYDSSQKNVHIYCYDNVHKRWDDYWVAASKGDFCLAFTSGGLVAFMSYSQISYNDLPKWSCVYPAIDYSSAFSVSGSDLSVKAPAGVQTPGLADDDTAPSPTITGVGDGTATSIEELLQKILEQLQANTLAPTLDLAGTETGGNIGTDEDAKPYLPYIPQIFEKIKELPGTLANIWESIKGIPAAIAEKIGAFFTTLWGWLQNIIDAITALPAAIAEKIGALFKPDEALLTEITDAFKGKFGFFSTLKQFGNDLFGMTPETEPPVIWVHLENAESKFGYNYGDKQKIFDMTWYQKYKASVDGLLSGFLWLGYLWLLFKRAPAILGGMQLSADDAPRSADMPDVLSFPRLGAGDGSTMYRGDGFTMRDKGGRSK